MLRRALLSPCLAACLALACGTAPSTRSPVPRPDLAASLVRLAEQALAAGDLASAEARFARALDADPGSTAARVGLGQTALARGDLAGAEAHFARALEQDPGAAGAQLGLARVAGRQGRAADARAHLKRALEADPLQAETHAELAALTGPAPRGPAGLEETLRRANAHPYDLAAGLAAANALAEAGRTDAAARRVESVLWLADLDPVAARRAWALLVRLDPSWREWRVVGVHSYADESIRAQPGWEFRLRLVWLEASRALGPLLQLRFVPASLSGFTSTGASASLEAIGEAFLAQTARAPSEGVLAAFTERPPPSRTGGERRGQAEFLGRRLVVRLEAESGRVLLHELVHLFGGVHVADDLESLMNPDGGGRALDALNARIVRETRVRRFRGNLDSDVLDAVDLEATTHAYEAALRANLALRRAGLIEALEEAGGSRIAARRAALEAMELDPHLGDVARFVALLYWRGDNPASAAFLLETAARLYGPRTARGRKAAEDAERIWQGARPGGGAGR